MDLCKKCCQTEESNGIISNLPLKQCRQRRGREARWTSVQVCTTFRLK